MTGSHLSQPTDNLAQVARCASRISSALGIGPPVLDAVHQTRSRFRRTGIVSVQLAAPPSLSGPARKFVGGQAARGCAGSVLIVGRWRSSRSMRSARSVVVNFHLNGFAA